MPLRSVVMRLRDFIALAKFRDVEPRLIDAFGIIYSLLQVTNVSEKLPEVESSASEHVFRLYVNGKRSFLKVCPSNDIIDVSRTE